MFGKRKDPERPNLEPSPVRKESNGRVAEAAKTPHSAITSTTRNTAMIGASIKIQGEISGEENLQIDGSVEGKVTLLNHDLTVGESGVVTANLTAKTVKIHGNVTGDIKGDEMVVVSKTGKVLGNIVSPRVTLEDGAQFKGSIDMTPATESSHGVPKSAPAKPSSTEAEVAASNGEQKASSAA